MVRVGRSCRYAVVSIALATAPAAAGSVVSSQEAFTRNVALLMYGEARCSTLRMNNVLLMQVAKEFKVTPADWDNGGRLHAVLASQYAKIKGEWGGQSDDVVCSVIEDSFGPGGAVVPDMIRRR